MVIEIKNDVKSYRPITILDVFSKIFETIALSNLYSSY